MHHFWSQGNYFLSKSHLKSEPPGPTYYERPCLWLQELTCFFPALSRTPSSHAPHSPHQLFRTRVCHTGLNPTATPAACRSQRSPPAPEGQGWPLALELSRLIRKTFHFVFSCGTAFGFLMSCAEEICSSETFLGRVKNGYFCLVNILVLFSFNIAEIPRALPDYRPLSLIISLDHLHPVFWSRWVKWKEVGRRVADGHSRDQHFLFSHLQWLHHPRPGPSF